MNTIPFNKLISYDGSNLSMARRYAIKHSGNLIFANIHKNDDQMYYIFANNAEMRIPTKEQFDNLIQYIGNIPPDSESTNIIDYIHEYVGDMLEWAIIGE